MKEALKLALEALESGVKTTANRISWTEYDCELMEQAITAIKEALAQPAQEAFGYWFADTDLEALSKGWFVKGPSDGKLNGVAGIALYTTPPTAQPEKEPPEYWIAVEGKRNMAKEDMK
jgi:hypothetical protein